MFYDSSVCKKVSKRKLKMICRKFFNRHDWRNVEKVFEVDMIESDVNFGWWRVLRFIQDEGGPVNVNGVY